ncbi:metallophosphoesterase [Clostridium sp. MSJ-11]|uniref:Metallophosphoesterase n=1 Tax=Clostridium mobile TaxID=2841512 RepID=A0ABS6EDA9_9CLOT|nr:metallophosphoesterase [Clostridium mobile]MBU5483179.1 metallophosphoesterase [Clostridium mobile]
MEKIILTLLIIILMSLTLYLQNNSIVITKHKIKSRKIPKEFNNIKILHLSDLHSKVFGKNNKQIINKINKEQPDIIVITGDFIDRRNYNEEKAMLLIHEIKDIAPIYYVTGNHEGWSNKFSSLEVKLKEKGVIVLRNESISIRRREQEIFILGVDDPSFNTIGYREKYKDYNIVKEEIEKIKKEDVFNVLLCHRPELFNLYVEKDIDLVFAGHAHGGQINIPFLGGIIAPNQGFFPKYHKGIHNAKNTNMVVSRGLGNSLFPQRLFNRPEIVCVELVKK